MKKIRWLLVTSYWLLIIFPTHATVLKLPTVTVMADHNLSLAITEIARDYSRNKQVIVNTSFTSQETQQAQINDGAAADILITAKESWIDELKLQGLIDIYSQTKLANDRLVLVTSIQSSIQNQESKNFPSLIIINAGKDSPSLLLGNPETLIEGVYAKEALRNLSVFADLEPYTLYVKRSDEMFDVVADQQPVTQTFTICFNSSSAARGDIKTIYTIPESSHKPISYNAVVIAGDNMSEARKFIDYLKTEEVKDILKKHGLNTD